MKSRERVFIALNRGIPDKFPRTENDIEEGLQRMIICEKLGMGGFGYPFPMGGKAATGRAFQADAGFKKRTIIRKGLLLQSRKCMGYGECN